MKNSKFKLPDYTVINGGIWGDKVWGMSERQLWWCPECGSLTISVVDNIVEDFFPYTCEYCNLKLVKLPYDLIHLKGRTKLTKEDIVEMLI